VRVGQLEVRVNGDGGVRKEAQMGFTGQTSPVLTEGLGRPTFSKTKEVVVLTIDEEGKVTKSVKFDEDVEQPLNKVLIGCDSHSNDKVMLEYRSSSDDREWAGAGLVATVCTRETLLAIQQRVEDAGFDNVEVLPMGEVRAFFVAVIMVIFCKFLMKLLIFLVFFFRCAQMDIEGCSV
jgi:hypothetical protein